MAAQSTYAGTKLSAFDSPTPSLLTKLGSLIVHADEALSPMGHPADVDAFRALLRDPEIQAWLDELRSMAMLPVKR